MASNTSSQTRTAASWSSLPLEIRHMIIDRLLDDCLAEEPFDLVAAEKDCEQQDRDDWWDHINHKPIPPSSFLRHCRLLPQISASFAIDDCLHHFRRLFLHFSDMTNDVFKECCRLEAKDKDDERDIYGISEGSYVPSYDVPIERCKYEWFHLPYRAVRKAFVRVVKLREARIEEEAGVPEAGISYAECMDFKEKMYRGLESIAKWKSVYGSMRGRAYRVAEKAEAEAEKIEVDHYEAREWNALSAEEKEAVRQKRIDDEEMQEAMELYSARERALKAQVSADASTANVCEGDAVSPEKGQTEA